MDTLITFISDVGITIACFAVGIFLMHYFHGGNQDD